MNDLISRQAVIDACMKYNGYGSVWACIMGDIKQLPSAQPEIIRCKDCTRFDKKRGCNLVEGLNIAKADSFCSYAERRVINDNMRISRNRKKHDGEAVQMGRS